MSRAISENRRAILVLVAQLNRCG